MQTFEKWPGEPEAAWYAFVAYRDSAYPEGISPGSRCKARSLRRTSQEIGVSYSSVTHLAAEFRWHERILCYDRWVDETRFSALKTATERTLAEHGRLLVTLRALVEGEISKWAQRAEEDPSVSVFASLKEAIQGLAEVIKLERLTLSLDAKDPITPYQADRYTEAWQRAKRWNLEACTLEELEAFERARTKAQGAEPVLLDTSPTTH